MLPECCLCACVSSNHNEVINCWRPFSVRFVRKLCGILGLKEESNLISFVTKYSRMDQVNFFKDCLSKFYSVHSWILWLICFKGFLDLCYFRLSLWIPLLMLVFIPELEWKIFQCVGQWKQTHICFSMVLFKQLIQEEYWQVLVAVKRQRNSGLFVGKIEHVENAFISLQIIWRGKPKKKLFFLSSPRCFRTRVILDFNSKVKRL